MSMQVPDSEIDEDAISGYVDVDGNPRVLPIVVQVVPEAYHEDVVAAVGRAFARLRHCSRNSLEGFSTEEANKLTAWEQGRVRKIVKRAKKGSAWDRALACYTPHVVEPVLDSEGREVSLVAVFPPLLVSDMPKDIARLQVSGLELLSHKSSNIHPESAHETYLVTVYVSPFLSFTTGKEAAQVAHAVQFSYKKLEEENQKLLKRWEADGFRFDLQYPNETEWLNTVEQADIVIRDAGFTEVPSGVRTVCAAISPHSRRV